MDSTKWPAFITGFVLGILVTLGVVGTFGWQKYQQARAEAEAAAAQAEMLEVRARQELRAAEEALRLEERRLRKAEEREVVQKRDALKSKDK